LRKTISHLFSIFRTVCLHFCNYFKNSFGQNDEKFKENCGNVRKIEGKKEKRFSQNSS